MKKKIKVILWPIIYLVLIINVCISFILVFRSYYFKSIFVSGTSMEPTLHGSGGYVDYGIIDDHKSAKNNIERFQIITTYYPFSDSHDYTKPYEHGGVNIIDEHESSYKIKRVYGLPGETIKFTIDDDALEAARTKPADSEEFSYYSNKALQFSVKAKNGNSFVPQKLNFKRIINVNPLKIEAYRDYEYELGYDEYWVMGDNYNTSSDCFSKKAPIYYDNIVGVLIAIEGQCKIVYENNNNTHDGGEDGTKVSYKCTNKKKHFPVFY